MTIEFFDSEAPSVDLEFAADFLKNNPKQEGNIFPIHSIKLAKSGKGYMLYTDSFLCWLFKKEKTATQIIEALEYYVKVGGGYQLIVKLSKKAKNSVIFGIDQSIETSYFPLGKGFSCLDDSGELQETVGNPFLIPLPSPLPVVDTAASPQREEGSGEVIPPALGKKALQGSVKSLKVR